MNTANLLQLAAFLDNVPPTQFDMRSFQTDGKRDLLIHDHSCGTAGCAVGWAPVAGFPILDDDSDWFEYSQRVFGLDWMSSEWDWCFSTDWMDIDNTPTGAAKRIRYLLEHGLPEDWDNDPTEADVRAYQ